MSEDTGKGALPRAAVIELMSQRLERLPEAERRLFQLGPAYLGANAALAGLVSNSLYRRGLHVRQAAFSSGLPMAALPFITTLALYNATVSGPLLSNDLGCPSCALARGALVGVLGGGVYPILLALPVNLGLAARYGTAPLPAKGAQLRFWVDISRPVLRKMRAVLLLQGLFGTYLSSRHFEIYTKMLQMTLDPQGEELRD